MARRTAVFQPPLAIPPPEWAAFCDTLQTTHSPLLANLATAVRRDPHGTLALALATNMRSTYRFLGFPRLAGALGELRSTLVAEKSTESVRGAFRKVVREHASMLRFACPTAVDTLRMPPPPPRGPPTDSLPMDIRVPPRLVTYSP